MYLRPCKENWTGWKIFWDIEWKAVLNDCSVPIVIIVGKSWAVANEGLDDSESLSVIGRERDLAGSSSVGGLVRSSESHDLELLLGSGLPLCNRLSLWIFADEELVVALARKLSGGDWCSDNVLRCGAEWVL